MNSCYTGDHTAEDHIHTDITKCNNEEPQQKYHLGTVSKRLLGGLKPLFCTLCFYHLFIYDLFVEMAARDSFTKLPSDHCILVLH